MPQDICHSKNFPCLTVFVFSKFVKICAIFSNFANKIGQFTCSVLIGTPLKQGLKSRSVISHDRPFFQNDWTWIIWKLCSIGHYFVWEIENYPTVNLLDNMINMIAVLIYVTIDTNSHKCEHCQVAWLFAWFLFMPHS